MYKRQTQKTAIERAKVPIPARASAQGKLFGSVGPVEVAQAVSATTGVDVDRAQVVLEEHVKELGEREVAIRLFGGVLATALIEVVPQA